jgi:hypothetical protein
MIKVQSNLSKTTTLGTRAFTDFIPGKKVSGGVSKAYYLPNKTPKKILFFSKKYTILTGQEASVPSCPPLRTPMAVVNRWSLFRSRLSNIISNWNLKMVVVNSGLTVYEFDSRLNWPKLRGGSKKS